MNRSFRAFMFQFLHTPFGLFASLLYRVFQVARRDAVNFGKDLFWIFRSREFVNFSYDLNDQSRMVLPHFVAQITGARVDEAERVLREIETDHELAEFYETEIARSYRRWASDLHFRPGRLLLHYAIVRLTKPRLVFEAGVDKGLGAIILNRALQRNQAEGYDVSYIGVEYRADRPVFLFEEFPNPVGSIRYASWSDVMQNLPTGSVDFFFYDAVFNRANLDMIATLSDRLSDHAVLVSAWTEKELFDIARKIDRHILTFHTAPKVHWYEGANLGILFRGSRSRLKFQDDVS
jgi:predicted O-methyltransferase YrrM